MMKSICELMLAIEKDKVIHRLLTDTYILESLSTYQV